MYYRLKLQPTTVGVSQIPIYINGSLACTHTIDIRCKNNNDLILKYLDKNGQYRFLKVFSKYRKNLNTSELGKTQNYITDLATDSTFRVVGVISAASLDGSTDWVDVNNNERYSDLLVSPMVYMYTNNNWVTVAVKAANEYAKVNDNQFISYDIAITLPNQNTTTLL
jgi:hypothetical protein